MLADLYITLKKYKEAIKIIHGLHARYAGNESAQVEGDPGGLPLDIAVKYGICHLFERDFKTAESMFNHLFAQDVEVFGDLYLDVADAFISLGDQDRRAAEILALLLGREEFPVEVLGHLFFPWTVWCYQGHGVDSLVCDLSAHLHQVCRVP